MPNNQNHLPLHQVFNNQLNTLIRWCTPSISPLAPQVRGIYENDFSVSYHALGNPLLDTGAFGQATELAAQAFGAEHTLFTVNGSTGSNFTVLKALKHQLGECTLLAQRNIHQSVQAACEDYHIDINYLPAHYDDFLQIFVPNTIGEIVTAVKAQRPQVLFLANPTYEGLSLDLPLLVKKLRQFDNKLIIFVDEAWGAHFHFSPALPVSAIEAGVDISVHSTHKQASGLQQTSMIHWQGSRIKSDILREAYRSLSTTSPSYHLLASQDAARYFLVHQGKTEINRLIEQSKILREKLARLPQLTVFSPTDLYTHVATINPDLHLDLTKTLVNLGSLSAPECARLLETQHGVIVEKYEAHNLLLIMPFQNFEPEINKTITAFSTVLTQLEKRQRHVKSSPVTFPEFPTQIAKVVPAYKTKNHQVQQIKLSQAEGTIAAETIVPYPPGIPLVTRGERVTDQHIHYLKALKKYQPLMSVMMRDQTINSLSVMQE